MAFQRYPNKKAIIKRADKIKMMFSIKDNLRRYNIARELHINYIFLGKNEEKRFFGCKERIKKDEKHYKQVYVNQEVAIYKVISGAPTVDIGG